MNILQRQITLIRRFPEPNNHTLRKTIDLGHQLNLLFFLRAIFLIDTYGVNPQDSREKMIPQMPQGCIQILRNQQLLTANQYRAAILGITPYIR
jgi:hypothetical protein